MYVMIWPLLAALLAISPLLLLKLECGSFDARSSMITVVATMLALAMPSLGFGDEGVVWKFFLGQLMLFASFVAISRVRNRKSLFLTALAGVGSNGGWYLAMFVLAEGYLLTRTGVTLDVFVGLLTAAVCGTLVGRLVAVQWMMWVEKRWQVRTDSVGSAGLRNLDDQTMRGLLVALFGCLALYAAFGWASMRDVTVVMTLGVFQSAVYTVNARLANRDHPGWPVISGLVASVVFMVHWVFLIAYTQSGAFMPLSLLVPYTVATIIGANFGVVQAMLFEKKHGITVDSHVKKGSGKKDYSDVTWHRKILFITSVICGAYLVASEQILSTLGLTAHAIVLPLTPFAGTGLERPAALFIGGLVFFASNITHTVSSRAGNRNHAPYHAVTCVIHGLMVFGTGSFVILNPSIPDLIPVAALGSALGQLFAQRFSMTMEAWLVTVMDVPEEKEGPPKPGVRTA
jgi:hypothetical protein